MLHQRRRKLRYLWDIWQYPNTENAQQHYFNSNLRGIKATTAICAKIDASWNSCVKTAMMIFFLQQVELKHKEIYISWITVIFKTWGEKQMNTLSVVFSSISNPENLDLWSPDPCHLNLHCTKNAPVWKLNHMLSLPSSQYTCINVHSILFLQTFIFQFEKKKKQLKNEWMHWYSRVKMERIYKQHIKVLQFFQFYLY